MLENTLRLKAEGAVRGGCEDDRVGIRAAAGLVEGRHDLLEEISREFAVGHQASPVPFHLWTSSCSWALL
jgi:hypothetical protein